MADSPAVPYDDALIAAVTAAVAESPSLDDPGYLAALRRLCAPVERASEVRAAHPGVSVDDLTVPGPQGEADVVLTVMRPPGPTCQGAIYYIHGGGMIAGNRFTHIDYAYQRAAAVGLALVSVEYRLAPEHPDPAPVEDCYAGLVWLAANAESLGIDPRSLILMGGSAGGGLAAGVSLLARDRGGPAIVAQLLLGPMLDDRNRSTSSRQFRETGVWDSRSNAAGWRALLGDRAGGDGVSCYAAPARAADLSGLPPTFIDAGSAEVFRDEVVDFASGLWAAGGRAELHVWAGGFHSFDVTAPDAAVSVAAKEAQIAFLRRVLVDY